MHALLTILDAKAARFNMLARLADKNARSLNSLVVRKADEAFAAYARTLDAIVTSREVTDPSVREVELAPLPF